MRLAKRMSRLGTETAFEVLVKARALEAQGRDVVHLEIGEPDFATPPNVVDAAIKALHAGETHYCPSAGLAELRQAIVWELKSTRGLEVSPDWVVVTPGGKPIMFYLLLALVEEGDEVLYPNPGFPIYESMINFAGGTPVPLPLLEKFNFRFDTEELKSKVTARTKLIIINSPQNPTGGLLTSQDLQAVADIALEREILVLSDEIYSHILYGETHQSVASLPGMLDHTVILDGFSKTYAMTGWRLGYGIMRPELQGHLSRLVTNSVSCTAPFVQRAGLEALAGAEDAAKAMVSEFRQRRDFLVSGLNKIPGIHCLLPSGAFYVFPCIKAFGMTSSQFADYLLNDLGVAALAGTAFGSYGEGYIRLSYANSIENLAKALDRIRKATARLNRG